MAPDLLARHRLQLARLRGGLGKLPPVKLTTSLCGADPGILSYRAASGRGT